MIEYPALNCVPGCIGRRSRPGLSQDVGSMEFDRSNGQTQFRCDFLARGAVSHKLQNLAFPCRQETTGSVGPTSFRRCREILPFYDLVQQ